MKRFRIIPAAAGRIGLLGAGYAGLVTSLRRPRRPDRADPVGLPAGQPLTANPYLLALTNEYTTTVRRLQCSFVGPPRDPAPVPLPEAEFWQHYRRPSPADPLVAAFQSLGDQAREASGLDGDQCSPQEKAYKRYREWLPFHCRRRIFIDRVSSALGYPRSGGT